MKIKKKRVLILFLFLFLAVLGLSGLALGSARFPLDEVIEMCIRDRIRRSWV